MRKSAESGLGRSTGSGRPRIPAALDLPRRRPGRSGRRRGDARLVERARDGDDQAFAALVVRYERKLIRVLTRLVRDEELARDLAQETFWKVYNRLDQFDTARRFGPWLFRIGVNLGLDQLRRHEAPPAASIDRPSSDGTPGVRPARPRPADPRGAGTGGPVHPGTDSGPVSHDPGAAGPRRLFIGGGGGDRRPPRGHGAVAAGQGPRDVPRTLGTPTGLDATGGLDHGQSSMSLGARSLAAAGRRRPSRPRSTPGRAAPDRLPAMPSAPGRARPGARDPAGRRGDVAAGHARRPVALARPGAADPRVAPACRRRRSGLVLAPRPGRGSSPWPALGLGLWSRLPRPSGSRYRMARPGIRIARQRSPRSPAGRHAHAGCNPVPDEPPSQVRVGPGHARADACRREPARTAIRLRPRPRHPHGARYAARGDVKAHALSCEPGLRYSRGSAMPSETQPENPVRAGP